MLDHLGELTHTAAGEVRERRSTGRAPRSHPSSTQPVMIVALEGWIDAGMARRQRHVGAAVDQRRRGGRHVRRRPAARPPGPPTRHAPGQRPHHRARLARHRAARRHRRRGQRRAAAHRRRARPRVADLRGCRGGPGRRLRVPHDRRARGLPGPGRPHPVHRTVGDHVLGRPRPTPCTATSGGPSTSPAGIHAVIDVVANDAGIPALGLWAQVPHYVASMPYPAASVALLEGLGEVAGLRVEQGQLPSDAKATRTGSTSSSRRTSSTRRWCPARGDDGPGRSADPTTPRVRLRPPAERRRAGRGAPGVPAGPAGGRLTHELTRSTTPARPRPGPHAADPDRPLTQGAAVRTRAA